MEKIDMEILQKQTEKNSKKANFEKKTFQNEKESELSVTELNEISTAKKLVEKFSATADLEAGIQMDIIPLIKKVNGKKIDSPRIYKNKCELVEKLIMMLHYNEIQLKYLKLLGKLSKKYTKYSYEKEKNIYYKQHIKYSLAVAALSNELSLASKTYDKNNIKKFQKIEEEYRKYFEKLISREDVKIECQIHMKGGDLDD